MYVKYLEVLYRDSLIRKIALNGKMEAHILRSVPEFGFHFELSIQDVKGDHTLVVRLLAFRYVAYNFGMVRLTEN